MKVKIMGDNTVEDQFVQLILDIEDALEIVHNNDRELPVNTAADLIVLGVFAEASGLALEYKPSLDYLE